jgi:flagellar hook-associated protein 3 FlgL
MTMRISTAQMHFNTLNALGTRQSEISKLAQQISSGVKLTRGEDDPVGMASALRLQHTLASLDQFDSNSAVLSNRLRSQETALSDAGDVLQRARDLTIQASNGILSDSDLHSIAVEMRGLRSSLLQISNRDDGTGRMLFAGNRDGVAPFTDNNGGVIYLGDDGQNDVDVAPSVAVADTEPGSAVFLRGTTGDGISRVFAGAGNTGSGVLGSAQVLNQAQWNGDTLQLRFTSPTDYEVVDGSGNPLAPPVAGAWTPGQAVTAQGVQFTVSGSPAAGDSFTLEKAPNQDIFTTLQNLIDALDSPGSTDADIARRSNALRAGQKDLVSAQDHLLDLRSSTGIRRAALDSSDASRSADGISLTETLSGLRDTDPVEAISQLQLSQAALDAAQQLMARIQRSSLFDLL